MVIIPKELSETKGLVAVPKNNYGFVLSICFVTI